MEARIEAWLRALSLDEKASLVAGLDLWHTRALPRLGIPALRVTDGPSGARGTEFRGGPSSACFPCGAALGASFDPRLVGRVGAALADEALDKGARVLLAPTVNLQRTPTGGRDFECHAEDPHLAVRMAAAFVRGVQSRGVAACAKHFVCNDVEWERHRASAEVDARTLREVYLAPFEAAVREAGAWSVMAAYNRLGGVHCTEHPWLLGELLRGEWGFDGAVISDWLAVRSAAPSLRAGLDLEMPGPPRHYGPKLAAAVRAGEVSEAALDESVRRVLRLLVRTGAADEAGGPGAERAVDRPEHRALAREAAAAGMVLLRNEAGALPLDASRVRRLAVIGPNAGRAVVQGGGSARVSPHYSVSPLEGIRARAPRGCDVVFEAGPSCFRTLPALAGGALEGGAIEVEYYDAPEPAGAPVARARLRSAEAFWLSPPPPLAPRRAFAARLRARLAPVQTGAHRFSLTSAGASRLRIDGRVVLDCWKERAPGTSFFGLGGAEVEASVALDAGRSVELEIDFATDRPGAPAGLRLGWLPPEPPDALERAVRAAREADAAVVVVGLDEDWETEGRDRDAFALPGRQDELVTRVAEACPRTIVVVNAGSPVAMDWTERTAAILQLWYPGQECGNALADVLFGDVDPGGRLPVTIPCRMEDTPAFGHCPGEELRLVYAEGVFVGHRSYDAREVEPRFPFGHGLSYARFEYGELRLARERVRAGDPIEAAVEVRNAGARAGVEVVQLYASDLEASVPRPVRELVAFEKVALAPGERRSVRLALGPRALAFWDVEQGAWRVEPGEFELAVGRSSRDLRARARLWVEGDGG